MIAKLTQTYVQNLKPLDKLYWVRDTLFRGFLLSVSYGGKKTFYADYRRKSDDKRVTHKIGDATTLTVAEARETAREILAMVERGEDPKADRGTDDPGTLSLGAFIRDHYAPWVMENRKSGCETVRMIQRAFKLFDNTGVAQITSARLEQWRSGQKKERGVKASSINREVAALRAALNWGVRMEMIETPSLSNFKPLKEVDSRKIVRYLSDDERARLMAALDEREEKMRQGRQSHNDWLKSRGQTALPNLGHFADHLKPMIQISLHTGIRQNALFSLEWGDVNLGDRTLFLRAETDKNESARYILMNNVVCDVFRRWREQSRATKPGNLVFPSPRSGKKINNCDSSWRKLLKEASIENFRWHDMRHDFASQLVMRGIDLNTVRELLGHADMKMTLRYAHLAPAGKRKAVEVLEEMDAAPSISA